MTEYAAQTQEEITCTGDKQQKFSLPRNKFDFET